MVAIDLHTHSIISYDGGLREEDYGRAISSGKLNCIAITDHNDISFAQRLQRRFGEQIIVGEEITTSQGEMIGLFLKKRASPHTSAVDTAKEIQRQGGIVYIPHPFETKRSGMQQATLESLGKYIDIIEVFNARGFMRGKPQQAVAFAVQYDLAMAAASDAHSFAGLGTAFSMIDAQPSTMTIVELLKKGTLQKQYAPRWSLFHPLFNKIRKKIF